MKKILCAVSALCLLSPGYARAEESARTPTKALQCAAGPARLASAAGKVLASHGGSFSELNDGATLAAGDRILVREGSAKILVGEKILASVGKGGMLSITENNGLTCTAKVAPHPAVAGQAGSQYGQYGAGDGQFGGNLLNPNGYTTLPGFGAVSNLAIDGALVAVLGGAIGGGVTASQGGNNNQQQQQIVLAYLSTLSHQ